MRFTIWMIILVLFLSACSPDRESVGIVSFLETTEARMNSPEFDIPITGPQAQATDYPAPEDDGDLEIPDTPVPFDPSDPTTTQPPDDILPPGLEETATALFETAFPDFETPTPELTGLESPTVSATPSLEATPTETQTPSPTASVTVSPTGLPTATPAVSGTVEAQPLVTPEVVERDSFLGEPLLFTDLAGYEVRNLNGNEIGGVSGVVYDGLSGQARYAVLAPTWALGINRGTVPVPWGAFNLAGEDFYSAQAGILLLPVDDHVLATGPTLDRALWQGRSPPDNWDAGIGDYWVNFVPVIPVTGEEDAPGGEPFLVSGPLLSTGPFFSGLDTDVTLVNGDTLAEVKDFILDADGAINYALVLVDDTFGLGGRLAPVPFDQLVWNPGGWFIFQGSATTLSAAPGYASRSALPNFSLPGWDADIRGYWAEK